MKQSARNELCGHKRPCDAPLDRLEGDGRSSTLLADARSRRDDPHFQRKSLPLSDKCTCTPKFQFIEDKALRIEYCPIVC